ncbi:MAG: HNH endonuclease [Deltaproteobacteria bacterium]|nr:HNH endonuclease [Deltaproteobacteria bacterium]
MGRRMHAAGRSSGDHTHSLMRQSSPMNADQLRELLRSLKVWRRGDERAPHKPLLLLLALAHVRRGDERLLSYADIDAPLRDLLRDFGPKRKSAHPEMPFWHLCSSGFWEVTDKEQIQALLPQVTKRRNPSSKLLIERATQGGFCKQAHDLLQGEPALVDELAQEILEAHFPNSYHNDILDAVGFQWIQESTRRPRDPKFRNEVLQAYEHRCAVCGFAARLGQHDLALEAAHVKWHCENGPDSVENGLALCVFHHRMLDRGALSIDDAHHVLVSKDVNGPGVDDLLLRYCGQPLLGPMHGDPPINTAYLAWHRKEVFRAPARVARGS